jgi:Tfp pilus assembly protein PilV
MNTLTAFPEGRTGASLIELIVAMTVITVALVAVSGMMTLNMRQAGIAEFRSDQVAVRQYAIERLRGLPFDSVADGNTSISGLTAAWTVVDSANSKIVTVVTGGPLITAGVARLEADTTNFRVVQP